MNYRTKASATKAFNAGHLESLFHDVRIYGEIVKDDQWQDDRGFHREMAFNWQALSSSWMPTNCKRTMINRDTTPEEIEQVKAAFKAELKALLLKYNASFQSDVHGDTHGLEYCSAIVLGVSNSFTEHIVVENPHSLYIDASHCD